MSTTLLSLEELGELETRLSHVLPEGTLMDRAGFVAANWIDDQCDAASTIVILCGQGNNGGDGYTAALHLMSRGHKVICVAIGGKKPKTEDALRAYNRWIEKGGEVIDDPYMAPKADVVVDAMLGVGITKAISGDYIDAALWFNERQALHMAIDVPTGIDAEKGNWVGGIKGCVADMTLNLISAKAGCFMNDGKDASGMVTLSELDVSVPLSSLSLIDTDDFKHILELRKYYSHKGTYGHCLVIGGDKGKVGAALLAARSALKLGAGSVTVELMAPNAPLYDPQQPELMITDEPVDFNGIDVIVIGCGMGFSDKAKARLLAAIRSNIPLIIDADALTMAIEALRSSGSTVSVAERCTGGLLSTLLTERPGASEYMMGSVTSYAASVKAGVLGVPETVIREKGTVSPECAIAMADGVRRLTGSDYSVSITGVAGPDEDEGKSVGTVHLGFSAAKRASIAVSLHFSSWGRASIRRKAAVAALLLLSAYVSGEDIGRIASGWKEI